MLTKQDWDEAAKRLLTNIEDDISEFDDSTYEVPVSHYLDENRWKREIDVIFKSRPVVLALSCELAKPDSYKAISQVGVPVLLTRDADGVVRGFINKCRHRGSLLTGDVEKCGVAKRFSCPYHAWTFDNKGALIGVPGQSKFGTVPPEYRHLIEIAVEERAGLIWGILTPGIPLDLDAHLGALLPMIEKIGADKLHFVGSNTMQGGNWKFVQDGFIEHYHFSVLHKDTVGEMFFSDRTAVDQFGPHLRYLVPGTQIRGLRDVPETEWQAHNAILYAFFVFPNIAFGFSPDADPQNQIFGLTMVWPGQDVGTSIIRQTFARLRPAVSQQDRDEISAWIKWQADFIQREDFWAIDGQQDGLASIADRKFIYGGLEWIAQQFERNVNASIDASYAGQALAAE